MGETFDLSTLFERDDVKRENGDLMVVRHRQELSIMQRHQLDAIIKNIQELDAIEDKSEKDAERGSELLHELANIVLVEPPDDLADWECASVFAFWLARANREGQQLPPPKPRRASSRKKSSTSSRGSNGSTAATRKRGSTGRRGS